VDTVAAAGGLAEPSLADLAEAVLMEATTQTDSTGSTLRRAATVDARLLPILDPI